jgi:hypothetical protein
MNRFYVQRRTSARFLLTLVLKDIHEWSAMMMLVFDKLESENRPTSFYCCGLMRTGVDGPCSTG